MIQKQKYTSIYSKRHKKYQTGKRQAIMEYMVSGSRNSPPFSLTDGTELANQDKIKTLGEKETYKCLGILEADTIKQVEMKEKK